MDKCKNKRMKINCSLENKWKNENEVWFKKWMKVKKNDWLVLDEKWIKVKNEWLVLDEKWMKVKKWMVGSWNNLL